MRRRRYEPYTLDVHVGTGTFSLEFGVAANERVVLKFNRYWAGHIIDRVMQAVRAEENEIAALRRRIREEANR
jgi:hypothetical protein